MPENIGIRVESLVANQTLTVGTNDSAAITNDGRTMWVLYILQGGGGVLVPSLIASLDGVTYVPVGPAITAVTIGTILRVIYSVQSVQGPIIEPFIKVRAVVTSSSATGVFATLAGL